MVRAKECQPWCQARRHHRDIISIFLDMKVCCVVSLESPHRGDSNEYTQYTCTIFKTEKKIAKVILNLQLWDFFQGT